jgi:hypothetical protein
MLEKAMAGYGAPYQDVLENIKAILENNRKL